MKIYVITTEVKVIGVVRVIHQSILK